MKKRKEVSITYLLIDDSAWADLLLSKTALILATVIILTAVYSLAGTSSDLAKKNELEAITVDIASNIDMVGTSDFDTSSGYVSYDPESYEQQFNKHRDLNISISGEYVACTVAENGNNFSAVRQLSYRTLPFSPEKLHSMLTGRFALDGSIDHPISSVFPYTAVTEFLANKGSNELYLNTSKELRIQKTSVFVTDGSEVNELEYTLVYQ